MTAGDGRAEDGRVVLVTGSARGLGRAVARDLADRGDRVHVVWRSSAAEEAGLREAFPGRVHRADLAREDEARRLVDAVVARDGRLDALVHAVGPYVSGPLAEQTGEDLARMLEGNVTSAWHVLGAARPYLRRARGAAVFFGCSGLAGERGRRRTAAYAAAKTALLVLARGWALEEAPHGVRVNVVSPGHVPHADAHPDTLAEERLEAIPLGRPGEPEDVARAVRWLLSDEAAHTTGTDLLVGGGWML